MANCLADLANDTTSADIAIALSTLNTFDIKAYQR